MMRSRSLPALVLLTASWLVAQAPSKEQFDDLAQRAQAALDKKPEEAIELYKQALAIRPDWPEGWLYMGGTLYQLGRYAEATDALRKGIGLAPVFANGWALLGLSESQLDDPDQALADIRKGEELGLHGNPQFEAAVRARAAQLLVLSSAFDEAMAQLQPLTQYPNSPPLVEELAGLCALGSASDLAQLAPERRAVVGAAGKAAWAFVAKRPDAAAAYQQLLAQYPTQPGVHYATGLFLMETGDKGALAEFQKELQTNPKHWPAMLAMATIEIRQGAPEKAMEAVQAATKIAPPKLRWLCHLYLGRANLDLKNNTSAISELEAAVRQKPSNASVHLYLSQAYEAAGRKADAEREKAEYEKAKAQDQAKASVFHPFGMMQ